MTSGLAAALLVLGGTAAAPPALDRTDLWGREVRGLSGLARDGGGVFFAVPERERHLVRFTVSSTSGPPRLAGPIQPITGAPPGVDLESLAWVAGETFAIGTESLVPARAHDRILLARLEPGRLAVFGSIDFVYRPFGLSGAVNAGLEGLCAAGGVLIAASETRGEVRSGGRMRRYSPLGVRHLERETWSAYRLLLTTSTGKISALACRTSSGAPGAPIEVVAVERHFAVARVLTFEVPRAPSARPRTPIDIEPEVLIDLGPRFAGLPPNFESIEWITGDALLLVSDNDHGTADGPAVVLRLR